MKIISVSGLDKSGKYTATQLLKQHFENKGLKVATFSLPNYETPIGKLIRQWLTGEYEADPKVFELLQAADKQDAQSVIEQHEAAGVDLLIIDRYIHSMWAYGAYDNAPDWLQDLTRYIRMPDAVVFMDVDPEVSMDRQGQHGANDKYESDLERLQATREEYHRLFAYGAGSPGDDLSVIVVNANNPHDIVKTLSDPGGVLQ